MFTGDNQSSLHITAWYQLGAEANAKDHLRPNVLTIEEIWMSLYIVKQLLSRPLFFCNPRPIRQCNTTTMHPLPWSWKSSCLIMLSFSCSSFKDLSKRQWRRRWGVYSHGFWINKEARGETRVHRLAEETIVHVTSHNVELKTLRAFHSAMSLRRRFTLTHIHTL